MPKKKKKKKALSPPIVNTVTLGLVFHLLKNNLEQKLYIDTMIHLVIGKDCVP